MPMVLDNPVTVPPIAEQSFPLIWIDHMEIRGGNGTNVPPSAVIRVKFYRLSDPNNPESTPIFAPEEGPQKVAPMVVPLNNLFALAQAKQHIAQAMGAIYQAVTIEVNERRGS